MIHLESIYLIVSDGYEDNYEQLSVINLIAKTCDGRKQYLKKVWEKENIKRYYTSKDNPNISNSMNIYCEGNIGNLSNCMIR